MLFGKTFAQNIVDPPSLLLSDTLTDIINPISRINFSLMEWGGSGRDIDSAMSMNFAHDNFRADWENIHYLDGYFNTYSLNCRKISAMESFLLLCKIPDHLTVWLYFRSDLNLWNIRHKIWLGFWI